MLPLCRVGAVDFSSEVLPVLQRACFECHGPEEGKGGLRLHTAEAVGHADMAEVLRRVRLPRGDKEAMPRRGEALPTGQIHALEAWVAAGAPWPAELKTQKHWSYLTPVRPSLPAGPEAPAHPVDAFLAASLRASGLAPAPQAEAAVLLRRLSLDLTGLPPAVPEVLAFEKASSANPEAAYLVAVDRLLASKEFGVRWARPWLDAARYADSHGFQRDDLREVWAFRDWVVEALNANMPFDRFTVEQVAGDLLPGATPSQVIATGFHRCTPTNVEAGTDPEESRINQVIDRVNTTGVVWLGTTLECAQCHDHKYDPFTQRDYYRLLACFNSTEQEADRANPKVPGSIRFNGVAQQLPEEPAMAARRKEILKKMNQLEARLRQKAPQPGPPAAAHEARRVLAAVSIDTESGAEVEAQADGSLLFTGAVADKDVYEIEYGLPADGEWTGVLVEALKDAALPGMGPGRGSAERPNFVLTHLEAGLVRGQGDKVAPEALNLKEARADFSQANFPAARLVDGDETTGWAIMPRFGESHWVALRLAGPVRLAPGQRLRLRLVQAFGGGRLIGRLRVSALLGGFDGALAGLPGSQAKEGEGLARERADLAALKKELAGLTLATTEVMRELPLPRPTHIFKRGVHTDRGLPVEPGTPEVIDAKAESGPGRLALARWLVSRENPLTARVIVNRWWAELFGLGIVATVEDFGIKGAPPTHPELLDWLAVEFMESGWDMKHLLRLLVTSGAYRQRSWMTDPRALAADPENTLLWHGPRLRMDAEMIRDNALAVAGLLNPRQGGPPVRPPQPEGLWAKVGGQQYDYQVSPGAEQHRRGLYVVLKRASPYPSFVNFDAGSRTACVVRRSRSNTPLQALTLLNDPVYVDAARALARRIQLEKADAPPRERIAHAVRLVLARPARPAEAEALLALHQRQSAVHGGEKAWQAVATALLNLDETITKE